MASPPNQAPRPRRPAEPLLAVVVLLGLALAGVVVLVLSDAVWGLALAVAAAALATTGAGLAARSMLAVVDDTAPRAPAHPAVVALGCVAAIAIFVAALVTWAGSSTRSTRAADATGAAQTLRAFLATAVLDDSAYPACEYLTPLEQQRVARLAEHDQTCRDALTATPPALRGVAAVGSLHALHLRTTVDGSRARISVTGSGTRPLTFTLRRTTPGELAPFEAPGASWRIAAGATALL